MSISVGEAAFSGFRLIGQKPLAVLMWGLTYMLALGIPAMLLLGMVGPEYIDFMRNAATGASSPASQSSFLAAMQKVQGFSSLINVVSLVVRAVLVTAVLRAVLQPEKKGFFYMRLGMEEVWQGLLSIALGFVIVGVILAIAIVGVPLGFALYQAPKPWNILLIVIESFVAAIVLFWAILRFSLAAPMTFAEKKFRLFESWKATKGHVWSLLGVILVLMVIIWLVEGVIAGTIFGLIASNPGGLKGFFQQSPDVWMKQMGPAIAVVFVLSSLLTGAGYAVFVAPFANIYRQLNPNAAAAF